MNLKSVVRLGARVRGPRTVLGIWAAAWWAAGAWGQMPARAAEPPLPEPGPGIVAAPAAPAPVGVAPGAGSEALGAVKAGLDSVKQSAAATDARVRELEAAARGLREQLENLKSQAVAEGAAVVEGAAVDAAQTVAVNLVWTLVAGFLVMLMQAGFALVETGFTREKNAAHTMAMNFMVYSLGMLGFWVCGFAIMFGGTAAEGSVSTVTSLGPDVGAALNKAIGFSAGGMWFGLAGNSGYFLTTLTGGIGALFLFQMVFMDTAATIPTGSMAERWRFLPFCLYAFAVGAFVYPIYGNWVWGGGWLAALGKNFGLGHGHVDFAGSSVVHMTGGVMALVGAWMLGPRIGKFNKDGTANAVPGHNLPMAVVGTFVLAFGWFGFNAGSTLSAMDTQIGVIAVNTMLASAAGAAAAMLFSWMKYKRPDPSFMCNGMLAGLVAVTAPCAFVDAWAAVLIGGAAGVLMLFSVLFVEEVLKVDDPVGAVSVHGVCGMWGVLAVGLFANGKYGAGWNGVGAEEYLGSKVAPGAHGGVTGLFYGDGSQLMAQLVGAGACALAVGVMAWMLFGALQIVLGNRVDAPDEIMGVDIPELGTVAYPKEGAR